MKWCALLYTYVISLALQRMHHHPAQLTMMHNLSIDLCRRQHQRPLLKRLPSNMLGWPSVTAVLLLFVLLQAAAAVSVAQHGWLCCC